MRLQAEWAEPSGRVPLPGEGEGARGSVIDGRPVTWHKENPGSLSTAGRGFLQMEPSPLTLVKCDPGLSGNQAFSPGRPSAVDTAQLAGGAEGGCQVPEGAGTAPASSSLSLSGHLNQSSDAAGHGKGPLLRRIRNAIGLMEGRYSINNLLFVTPTLPDSCTDLREANRRFNSLATHVLNERFLAWLVVVHRRADLTVHFHLVVATGWDVGRDTFDFKAARQKIYRGVCPRLREEWAYWRSITNYDGRHPECAYPDVGWTELMPIRSRGLAVARYVISGYFKRGLGIRLAEDKGKKLVRFSSVVALMLKAHGFNSLVVSKAHLEDLRLVRGHPGDASRYAQELLKGRTIVEPF
jgi:hypothetical protein